MQVRIVSDDDQQNFALVLQATLQELTNADLKAETHITTAYGPSGFLTYTAVLTYEDAPFGMGY